MSYGKLRPTSGWDLLASLRQPCKFQRVSRLGSVTAWHSSSGRQPNFEALNRGCHLYSAGRPSRWALAHILVSVIFCRKWNNRWLTVLFSILCPVVKPVASLNLRLIISDHVTANYYWVWFSQSVCSRVKGKSMMAYFLPDTVYIHLPCGIDGAYFVAAWYESWWNFSFWPSFTLGNILRKLVAQGWG